MGQHRHKRLHAHEDGIAHFFLLVIVVVLIASSVGYFVWTRLDEDGGGEAVFTPAPSVPCEGEWIDSHAHQDELEFSQELAEQMRDTRVGCSVLFVHFDLNNPDLAMLRLREEVSPNPGRYILFTDLIGDDLSEITRQKLDAVIEKYPDIFKGLGEFAFYRPPQQGSRLDGEPWDTIFDFAGDNGLVVMLHLTENEQPALEAMLERYPNTKVLIHHKELLESLPSLLKRFGNLYYTLDTTNLTTISGARLDNVLMYPQGEGNSEDFFRAFNANRATMLDTALKNWLPVIEAAPDRVMWGTDVSVDWHIEPAVYEELLKFSEDFIAKLPEQYREGYKYQNAKTLFGEGAALERLTDAEFDQLDAAEEDD